jgi:hypothetical protein
MALRHPNFAGYWGVVVMCDGVPLDCRNLRHEAGVGGDYESEEDDEEDDEEEDN